MKSIAEIPGGAQLLLGISLMDSAYDAQDIRSYIEGKGRLAIIDGNKRRSEGAHHTMQLWI